MIGGQGKKKSGSDRMASRSADCGRKIRLWNSYGQKYDSCRREGLALIMQMAQATLAS